MKSIITFFLCLTAALGWSLPLHGHLAAVARIKAGAADPNNPGKTGLYAWWELNDAASPSTWEDAHTGNLDLTKTGTVTSATGLVGGDADFDGSTGYLENASVSTFHTSDFTFGMWVNFDVFGTNVPIGGRYGNSSETYQGYFYRPDTNYIGFVVQAGGYFIATSDTTYASSGWHFIVAKRASSVLTLYIDGAAQADVETISGTEKTDAQPFRLGEGGAGFLNGKIDEVFIYTRALTPAEITWLYNSGSGRAFSAL